MFRLIPFMIVPLALYLATVGLGRLSLDTTLMSIGLPSGAAMRFTLADGILLVGMASLFVELVLATGTRSSSLINHGLSMLLFILGGLAFLFIAACGTGTFLLLVFLMLVDVVAGYSIGMITARRDLAVEKE